MSQQTYHSLDDATAAAFFRAFFEAASEQVSEGMVSPNERLVASPIAINTSLASEVGGATLRLINLIHSLPDRLFSGDVRAFGKACGFSDDHISAMTALPSTSRAPFARSDAYLTDEGWKFTEFNIGSSIGGFHLDEALKAIEHHPLIAAHIDAQRLTRKDTARLWATMVIREANKFRSDSEILNIRIVASLDFRLRFAHWNEAMAQSLRKLGADVTVCEVGDLEVRADGVYVNKKRIHYVYRLFGASDICRHPELYSPLINSAKEGNIGIGMPLDSRLFSNKATLALLWDPTYVGSYSGTELEDIRRYVPNTRLLTEKALADALALQSSLVAKPVNGECGKGVIFGEDFTVSGWASHLQDLLASNVPYVLQQRIFPSTSSLIGWSSENGLSANTFGLVFGAFAIDSRFGGLMVRATPFGGKVLSYAADSYTGMVFESDAV